MSQMTHWSWLLVVRKGVLTGGCSSGGGFLFVLQGGLSGVGNPLGVCDEQMALVLIWGAPTWVRVLSKTATFGWLFNACIKPYEQSVSQNNIQPRFSIRTSERIMNPNPCLLAYPVF